LTSGTCTTGRLTEGTVTSGTVIAGSAGAVALGAGIVTVGAFASAGGELGFDIGACEACGETVATAGTVGVAVASPAT
jgi:hypothetical protein